MKIINLKSENVKRLNAIEITPSGDVVVIGGNNAQGKSSVLDSIAMALGGKDAVCDKPLRKGAKNGKTVVTLDDDLVITRAYADSGTTSLTVTNKAGLNHQTPQTVLDKLTGRLTFDPLGFTRMESSEQLELLQKLVGLDFTALNQQYQTIYDQRTLTNREVKRLEPLVAAATVHPKAPAEEVSISHLNQQLQEANATNNAQQRMRDAIGVMNLGRSGFVQLIANQDAEVVRLESALLTAQHELARRQQTLREYDKELAEKTAQTDALIDVATASLIEAIALSETTNRQVRENKATATLKDDLDKHCKYSGALTSQLNAILKDKETQLAAAQFPVAGLSFTDTGILFNGLPFDQASSAEQLRVSVAIGMAMNPTLRVLLCRDGSLLDQQSMALLADIVKEHDYQLWIERVGEDATTSVIIENGYVKEAA